MATNPGDALSVCVRRNGKRAALMAELQREEIVARIKRAREEAGMSQVEMGDALNVHWRTVQNYETVRVPFALLGRIAEVTGKTTEWLLHGETPDLMESLNGPVREQLNRIEADLARVLQAVGALVARDLEEARRQGEPQQRRRRRGDSRPPEAS